MEPNAVRRLDSNDRDLVPVGLLATGNIRGTSYLRRRIASEDQSLGRESESEEYCYRASQVITVSSTAKFPISPFRFRPVTRALQLPESIVLEQ